MGLADDKHLDVCKDIEIGLKKSYEKNQNLTDNQCILSLENAKIAIKKNFGYAQNEKITNAEESQGIIKWCVEVGLKKINKVNDLTLKEYIRRIDKVQKSVKRHSNYGRRGYYEFIRNWV